MEETNNRIKKIEEYTLDPDKAIFNSITDFEEAVVQLLTILKDVNLNELEKLQGQDGYTPQKGVDYWTDEDINAIDQFISERMPVAGVDYETIEATRQAIADAVAAIPRVKGDRGEKGERGVDGKDGSPDTATQIIEKLRSLSKNKGLQINDIRGLSNALKRYATTDDIDELRKAIDDIPLVFPAATTSGSGGSTTTDTLTDGTNTVTAAQARNHIDSTANPHNVTKAQVGLSNVDNTSDVNKPVSNATQTALNAKADLVGGKVPTTQLPAIAITSVYTVASQTAQLALTAQEGDVAIRSDQSKTYIHNGGTAGTMADWSELPLPTGGVSSVNGQSGVVTLVIPNASDAAYDQTAWDGNLDVPTKNAVRDVIATKANLASPTFTGTPTAPTAAVGTNTTQLATTAFVKKEIVRPLAIQVTAGAITTGDGKAYAPISPSFAGMDLVSVHAVVMTPSTSGLVNVQVARGRQATATSAHTWVDMLSTAVTIDVNEYHSKDATTAAVINTANDDVALGDVIRIDVDGAGTGATVLQVVLEFRLP